MKKLKSNCVPHSTYSYKLNIYSLNAIKSVYNQTLDKKYSEIITYLNYIKDIIDDYIKNNHNHVAKLVSRSSTAGKAVFVAIAAPIYFIFIFFILSLILGLFLSVLGVFLALFIAFLALVHFIGRTYNTGMAGGFLIAILALIILVVISFIVGAVLAVSSIFAGI